MASRSFRIFYSLLVLLVGFACSVSHPDLSIDEAEDAGQDVADDALIDVFSDVPLDAPVDGSEDAPLDTAEDVAFDVMPDVAIDAMSDVSIDVTPDVAPDVGPSCVPGETCLVADAPACGAGIIECVDGRESCVLTPVAAGTACRAASECFNASACNGVDLDCPEALPAPLGTACAAGSCDGEGRCRSACSPIDWDPGQGSWEPTRDCENADVSAVLFRSVCGAGEIATGIRVAFRNGGDRFVRKLQLECSSAVRRGGDIAVMPDDTAAADISPNGIADTFGGSTIWAADGPASRCDEGSGLRGLIVRAGWALDAVRAVCLNGDETESLGTWQEFSMGGGMRQGGCPAGQFVVGLTWSSEVSDRGMPYAGVHGIQLECAELE